MVSLNPKVNKVFVFEKDEYREALKRSGLHFLKKTADTLKEIHQENFDALIDLSLNSQINFFLQWTGIRERIGFNYKGRGRFLTKKIPLEGYEKKHVVEYYLDLLVALGFPIKHRQLEIFMNAEDQHQVRQAFEKNGFKASDRLIAVFPGGGASWGPSAGYKRWAAENYAELCDKMIEKFSAKVILMGNPEEKGLCRFVVNAMRHPAMDLSGEFSLGQSAAALKGCRLAVLNDGGPLHMAVAVGIKTVSVFGPVDEHVYGPFPPDSHEHEVVTSSIPCRPCYRRFRMAECEHRNCLKLISVNQVLEKVARLL